MYFIVEKMFTESENPNSLSYKSAVLQSDPTT